MLSQAYALELASDFGTKKFESIGKENLLAALNQIRKISPLITHSSEDKRKKSGGFFGKILSIFQKNKK